MARARIEGGVSPDKKTEKLTPGRAAVIFERTRDGLHRMAPYLFAAGAALMFAWSTFRLDEAANYTAGSQNQITEEVLAATGFVVATVSTALGIGSSYQNRTRGN